MEPRTNSRGIDEMYESNAHLNLHDLGNRAREFNRYINNDVPAYPRPEFHVSHLKHDTDAVGLRGIKSDRGFKDPGHEEDKDLLWWSLAVKPEDVTSAERRLLEETYPDQAVDEEEEREEEEEEDELNQARSIFLGKFASSPAFLNTSMFGSYRFTFRVKDVLKAYSKQVCDGKLPVMRVYETVLYKKKVMYVVLVHSPEVQGYDDYPLLSEDDPEAVCCYKDGQFIWRSQAMCGEHRYELVQRPEINQMAAVPVFEDDVEYYVWDQVAIALHMKTKDQVLNFTDKRLRTTLTFCKGGARSISRDGFQSFKKAKEIVKSLWPKPRTPLEKERSLQETP